MINALLLILIVSGWGVMLGYGVYLLTTNREPDNTIVIYMSIACIFVSSILVLGYSIKIETIKSQVPAIEKTP